MGKIIDSSVIVGIFCCGIFLIATVVQKGKDDAWGVDNNAEWFLSVMNSIVGGVLLLFPLTMIANSLFTGQPFLSLGGMQNKLLCAAIGVAIIITSANIYLLSNQEDENEVSINNTSLIAINCVFVVTLFVSLIGLWLGYIFTNNGEGVGAADGDDDADGDDNADDADD